LTIKRQSSLTRKQSSLTEKQSSLTEKQGFLTEKQGFLTKKQSSLTKKRVSLTEKQTFRGNFVSFFAKSGWFYGQIVKIGKKHPFSTSLACSYGKWHFTAALTLTLSPREREQRFISHEISSDARFADWLTTILPLPPAEGRGEGGSSRRESAHYSWNFV